jgi:hypothetical protein
MNKIYRTVLNLLVILAFALANGCNSIGTLPASETMKANKTSPSPMPTKPINQASTATYSMTIPVTQVLPTAESLPTWWRNPTPGPSGPIQVTKTGGIHYTSEESLDVYNPITPGDWPVVIVFHASGDDKSSIAPLAEAISEQGAVVFVPTRHSAGTNPISGNPIGFEDAACSVRFTRAQASAYGGNSSRLVAVGYAEGGLMGALMMLAGDEFNADCLVQEGSALVDIFLGLDGIYDPIPFLPDEMIKAQPEVCLRIDPYTYIGRDPKRSGIIFMLFVGSDVTSQKQAQAFRDALQAASYEVLLMQIPGVDHNEMVKPQPQVIDAIATLLRP